MEDFAAERCASKHSLNERFEFHVAMIEFCRDGPGKLYLVCLETGNRSVIFWHIEAD